MTDWSRFVRLARKTQQAIIVTDDTGQDPLVLLPLSTYEQFLALAPHAAPERGNGSSVEAPAQIPRQVPRPNTASGQAGVMVSERRVQDPGEERFYLEPVE